MSSVKDSQDWLVDILIAYGGGGYPGIALEEAKLAIREHILQEALSLIGEDLPLNTEPNTGQRIHNKVKLELRNKFNDKYKED